MFQMSCNFVAVYLEAFLDHKLLGGEMCIKKTGLEVCVALIVLSAVICFSVTVVNLMLLDNCLWKLVSLSVLTP